MATEKQIAANRQNAKCSTGPRTDQGKRRSRRNALRHGLMAETVVEVLEDSAAYKTLQRAISADYRPRSNFELELVARLVSLLWRLRRAVAIESGLMSIQASGSRKQTSDGQHGTDKLTVFCTLAPALVPRAINSDQPGMDPIGGETTAGERMQTQRSKSDLAWAFMRSSRFDSTALDRLNRYETTLWRQVVQITLLLNAINRGAGEYAACDGTYLQLRNVAAKRRRILWPPFSPERR